MREIILEELNKENPNWLLISNTANKLYIESNKSSFLGIRENIINLVKVADHCVSDVVDFLEPAFPGKVIGVGGYRSMTVTKAVKYIKSKKDETLIIVTDRDALLKHLGSYQFFRCNIKNKYSKEKTIIRWTNVETGEITDLSSESIVEQLRDYKLNEILN